MASDHLRSLDSSINGIPLRILGRTRSFYVNNRKDLAIVVKLRKVKKYEYPWPEDPDINVKGGVLTHLSHFKPLKEKPKPITLDFEKPLMDLQKKIIDVRKMASETGLDFTDQIASLEDKYQQVSMSSLQKALSKKKVTPKSQGQLKGKHVNDYYQMEDDTEEENEEDDV